MIVCHCAGVTDHAITAVIRDGASSVKDVVQRTGAGRCCAPCRDEIRSLLGAASPRANDSPPAITPSTVIAIELSA
jgi:bacterioferritin-associated ferredoxin